MGAETDCWILTSPYLLWPVLEEQHSKRLRLRFQKCRYRTSTLDSSIDAMSTRSCNTNPSKYGGSTICASITVVTRFHSTAFSSRCHLLQMHNIYLIVGSSNPKFIPPSERSNYGQSHQTCLKYIKTCELFPQYGFKHCCSHGLLTAIHMSTNECLGST